MTRIKSLLILAAWSAMAGTVSASPRSFSLKDNWRIQSSARVQSGGSAIARISFNDDNWYRTSVPSTVLGTLVADGVYKDVFRGRNLDTIPGSIFQDPWWYRTAFRLLEKQLRHTSSR